MIHPPKTPCAGCVHRRPVSRADGDFTACHYLLDTGEPRGCAAAECWRKKIHYQEKNADGRAGYEQRQA